MGWFLSLLRRPRGRHALGAAVTSIPSARLHLVAPVPAGPAHAAPLAAPAPAGPAYATPLAVVHRPAPTVAMLPSTPALPASRVQLGFRDGSTASLAAGSEQAVALEALAGLLNRRSS